MKTNKSLLLAALAAISFGVCTPALGMGDDAEERRWSQENLIKLGKKAGIGILTGLASGITLQTLSFFLPEELGKIGLDLTKRLLGYSQYQALPNKNAITRTLAMGAASILGTITNNSESLKTACSHVSPLISLLITAGTLGFVKKGCRLGLNTLGWEYEKNCFDAAMITGAASVMAYEISGK